MAQPTANRKEQPIDAPIFEIRGQRVILDADLASLYGVTTKRFNEAVKRNRRRFPGDFAFQLTLPEFASLKSQLVTSRSEVVDPTKTSSNWSQIATSSNRSRFEAGPARHRGVAYRPWAFTEHGALMAANVLKTERAAQMSIYVIRAFVRLREHAAANATVLKRLAEIDTALLQHDGALRDLYRKLRPLLEPPPQPSKRPIGFVAETSDDEQF